MRIDKERIVFTGGGSVGHVSPNIALIEQLLDKYEIHYIGSYNGIERKLVENSRCRYHPISSGKLRRYFSWKNFIDPFKVFLGIIQAIYQLYLIKPRLVFSKGGFVGFPVAIAAWILRIPIIIHEADLTIGLANRLVMPLANKICLTFFETINQIKIGDRNKILVTGLPLRKAFFNADPDLGRKFCSYNSRDKKIIVVMGGSLGARKINQIIREALPILVDRYQIIHICGKRMLEEKLENKYYKQFEYLDGELFASILSSADLVIARAGANTIYELVATGRPGILIPLPESTSRGDQIANANYYLSEGFGEVIMDSHLNLNNLLRGIAAVEDRREEIRKALSKFILPDATQIICNLIADLASKEII